ncbi:Uncharacterised protein [Legionella steigerwaltii]|uniref:Uncharacterized protein n=2 Tax=Legionella steigerwaltii TaxID=460 RepID=A0A378L6F1_9GAMM|nr:hypothetical protein Lstg_3227 [Legionella steigerwaltii]STY21492.1 Uncharacterised protein [Legionella steigerwaltii]
MSTKINLELQVQGSQYYPRVTQAHEKSFAHVGQLAIHGPDPVEITKEEGETLREIIHLIQEDNKQLLQAYDQCRKAILNTAVDADLTPEQFLERLLNLYMRHPPQSNSTVSLSALEQSKGKPVIAGVPEKQQTITSLVNALAYSIATKQVDADIIFDELEARSTASLGIK